MVNQGDIIKICFDPTKGHEQSGYRPALVVSNDKFNAISPNLVLACPITNTKKSFPLHVDLDGRTSTSGTILVDQIRSIDITTRGFKFVEKLPVDLVDRVINTLEVIICK